MPINIEDLPTAVRDYIGNKVSIAISPFNPLSGTHINPGDPFQFTVSATNTGTVALSDLVYHVKVLNANVAKLSVPLNSILIPPQFRLVARASADPAAPALTPGSLVTEMFLFPEAANEVKRLDAGETGTISLTGTAGSSLSGGSTSVQFNILADANVNDLLPKDDSSKFVNGSLTVEGV